MTSGRAALRKRITERNIQDAVVAWLRWHGWMVRELSQPRAVTRELVGVPDVIAFKLGVTLLIECKRPGGGLRPSQRQFINEIEPHQRETLVHLVVSDIDSFHRAFEMIERAAGIVTVREER